MKSFRGRYSYLCYSICPASAGASAILWPNQKTHTRPQHSVFFQALFLIL